MKELLSFMDAMFKTTVDLSVMGGIAALAIFLIKLVSKKKLGIKFQYALWFILILRLMLPFEVSSKISLYNYIPAANTGLYRISDYSTYGNMSARSYRIINNSTSTDSMSEASQAGAGVSNISSINNGDFQDIDYIPSILWMLVIVILSLALASKSTRFLRKIRHEKIVYDENIIKCLEECKHITGVKKDIKIVMTNEVKTPSVYGFLKPKILLPYSCFNEENLIHTRYALLHELVHVKHNDIFINYITVMLSLIHWFNPLIWYAFAKMRDERELRCDLYVLGSINEYENLNYGFAIIKFAELSSRAPWLPGMAAIINNKSKTKRRIVMIKNFKSKSLKFSALAVALLLVFGCIMLTSADAKTTGGSNAQTEQGTENKGHPGQIIFDKIDYPFENDEQLVGKWETVDFVPQISDFSAGQKHWKSDMYLTSMTVLENGEMAQPVAEGISSDEKTPVGWLTWTKGYIIHHGDVTASKYTIQEINGEKYMFMEWKSGDYSLRGMQPFYYVFKKVN